MVLLPFRECLLCSSNNVCTIEVHKCLSDEYEFYRRRENESGSYIVTHQLKMLFENEPKRSN